MAVTFSASQLWIASAKSILLHWSKWTLRCSFSSWSLGITGGDNGSCSMVLSKLDSNILSAVIIGVALKYSFGFSYYSNIWYLGFLVIFKTCAGDALWFSLVLQKKKSYSHFTNLVTYGFKVISLDVFESFLINVMSLM